MSQTRLIIENIGTRNVQVFENLKKLCYDNLAKTLEFSYISADMDNAEVQLTIHITDNIRFFTK